jgi:hypothetical protein
MSFFCKGGVVSTALVIASKRRCISSSLYKSSCLGICEHRFSMSVAGQSDIGTIACGIYLPWPWPPTRPVTLITYRINGYTLEATCGPPGVIRAIVMAGVTREPIITATSCPIHLHGRAFVMLTVQWDIPSSVVAVYLNGDNLVASNIEGSIPASFEVAADRQSKSETRRSVDFSKVSRDAEIRRKDTLAGSRAQSRRRVGMIPGGRTHIMNRWPQGTLNFAIF